MKFKNFLARLIKKSWRVWKNPHFLHIFNANSKHQLIIKTDIIGLKTVEIGAG